MLSHAHLQVLTTSYIVDEVGRIGCEHFANVTDLFVVHADTRLSFMLTFLSTLSLRSNAEGFGWH